MMLERVVDDIPEEPWDDPELLWELYRERDWSQRTIAYEFGVDKQTVLKGLIQNNVLQPWTDKEMLEDSLEKHQTPANVSEEWNCSELTIRRWMDRHELRKRAELTPDLLRELYHNQMLTAEEVADDLGYAPVEIQMALREYDIERRDGSDRFS